MQPLDITVHADLECLWVLVRPRFLPREVPSIVVAAVYNPRRSPGRTNY